MWTRKGANADSGRLGLQDAAAKVLEMVNWIGEEVVRPRTLLPVTVTDSDQAWKQINYFTNNQERMDYPRYRPTLHTVALPAGPRDAGERHSAAPGSGLRTAAPA